MTRPPHSDPLPRREEGRNRDASLWYRFCRGIYRIYFRLYHRGRIIGRDHVPDTGGIILAGNHVSFLDPPMFGQACRRGVYFLARDTLFRHPLANWLLRSWNVLPLRRDRGDIGAMRTVLQMLADGKGVVMFPEGTRSPDGQLQRARAGIGMIVARARVPVVPMRIFGADRAMPRGKTIPRPAKLTIIFGEPLMYPLPANFEQLRGDELKALYQAIGDEIMRRIAALRPD